MAVEGGIGRIQGQRKGHLRRAAGSRPETNGIAVAADMAMAGAGYTDPAGWVTTDTFDPQGDFRCWHHSFGTEIEISSIKSASCPQISFQRARYRLDIGNFSP
ncbi:MAG: hypothetical protein WA973_09650 [Mesorhizobium sp.]